MKQKEKTQVVRIRIKMDIIYDPVGLEGITGQSMSKSVLMCLITTTQQFLADTNYPNSFHINT